MAIDKKTQSNIDNSDLTRYPNGRIRDDDGSGNGTAVNRNIYGDIHEFFAKLMRLAKISYNGNSDNETDGYQYISALENFAGKNDKIQSLTTVGGEILIGLKLGTIVENEFLTCVPNFNLEAQTIIKGNDTPSPVTKTISFVPSDKPFKSGETIRLFYNGTSFVATRLADANNISLLVSERDFLKAATEAEEYAASSQTKATTPYTNGLAFARRVFGIDSVMFLANSSRNGIYSKEHFSIVENLAASPVKNIGWVGGINIGDIDPGELLPVHGDITNAVIFASGAMTSETFIECTMAHAMDNTDYYIRMMPQSIGTLNQDDDLNSIVFKPISTTKFQLAMKESAPGTQNLRVHLEVVQIQ